MLFPHSLWCWTKTAWPSAPETWDWRSEPCLGINDQSKFALIYKYPLIITFCVSANIHSFMLFSLRLDLVPINRSVGLKAKPTKPVTEVLRPVVAKYGLHLSDLVAKIVSRPRWLPCLNPFWSSCVSWKKPVQCVTVPQGGVSWFGEGSNRILFHLYTVVNVLTQPSLWRWSTRAIIKNDDTPQTCRLFTPPLKPCQMIYFSPVGFQTL